MKRAFTYLELIATIAIIAILLSISALKLGSFDTIRERNEAKMIVNDLNHARNLAIATKTYIAVEVHKNDLNGYRIRKSGGALNKPLKVVELKYLNRESTTFQNKGIIFNSLGRTNEAGNIIYNGRDKNYEITIGVGTGKVNIKVEKK